MKKLILIIFSIGLSLLVVSCSNMETSQARMLLNGESEITLSVGSAFVDPGVVAIEEDTFLDVQIRGQVNTSVPGSYILLYEATDSNGNVISQTRTITVIDDIGPEITLVGGSTITVNVGEVYEEPGAQAIDGVDGGLGVSIEGTVDPTTSGTYELIYRAIDEAGNETTVIRTVVVMDLQPEEAISAEVIYEKPTGVVNFRFSDAELKTNFIAAAERYLLENVAGVPLYDTASTVFFSNRVILDYKNPVAKIGFGEVFSLMNRDDQSITGQASDAGVYTLRAAIGSIPYNLSPSTSLGENNYQNLYAALLFRAVPNSTNDGFDYLNDIAKSRPVAINPRTTNTGILVSSRWQIEIRDDLVWSYHPDTDTSEFSENHERLSARTIAISLPIIFQTLNIPESERIYTASDSSGRILDLEFQKELTMYEVLDLLSSDRYSIVHPELYYKLGGDESSYGSDPSKIAYLGPYKIDRLTRSTNNSDQLESYMRLARNPNYPNSSIYNYDYIEMFDYLDNFQQYLNGNLDVLVRNGSFPESNLNPELVRQIPGLTTFRLNFNAHPTLESNQLQWNTARKGSVSGLKPERIMSEVDFRRAISFALDRDVIVEILKSNSVSAMPTTRFFSPSYRVDASSTISYVNNNAASGLENILKNESGNSFDPILAKNLFNQTLTRLIQEGYYKNGDTISLIFVGQNSSSQRNVSNYIKSQLEKIFVNQEEDIRVQIDYVEVPFPQNYLDYILTGRSHLGVGGVSVSEKDLPKLLQQFRYDNSSGYTLTWGIDTREANIPLEYSLNSITRKEILSFDAISNALLGDATLFEGTEID